MTTSHIATPAAPAASSDWRELASRENDGLEVSLLWSKSEDRVRVAVVDERLDETFEFDIAGADALAAFNHPFAFAPSESVSSLESVRRPLDLYPQV
jgi:hypothetical protein